MKEHSVRRSRVLALPGPSMGVGIDPKKVVT